MSERKKEARKAGNAAIDALRKALDSAETRIKWAVEITAVRLTIATFVSNKDRIVTGSTDVSRLNLIPQVAVNLDCAVKRTNQHCVVRTLERTLSSRREHALSSSLKN